MLFGNSKIVGVFFLDENHDEVFTKSENKALMASYRKKDKLQQLSYITHLGKFSATIDALKSRTYSRNLHKKWLRYNHHAR